MEWAIPPEIWALAGVVLGTFIPSAMTFFTGRQQAKHEANKALIEALERRIGDLETHLREETSARRALEVEVRRREEEAHSAADRARLVMSVAVAHINRLTAHIEAGSPPPPPTSAGSAD
jgi:C4-dicarboxylate-specific signal transduction histidine kinase